MTYHGPADREITAADGIFAVDPESGKGIQLWGQECCAGSGPTSVGFRMLRSLEVDVENLGAEAVLSLIGQVERVKGALPFAVSRLRDRLINQLPSASLWI